MSRGFWELLLLLFNSAVRPAETGERSCRGAFPDESLGVLPPRLSSLTTSHNPLIPPLPTPDYEHRTVFLVTHHMSPITVCATSDAGIGLRTLCLATPH